MPGISTTLKEVKAYEMKKVKVPVGTIRVQAFEGAVHLLLYRKEHAIEIVVTEEKNGDARIELSPADCSSLISMLSQASELIKNGTEM